MSEKNTAKFNEEISKLALNNSNNTIVQLFQSQSSEQNTRTIEKPNGYMAGTERQASETNFKNKNPRRNSTIIDKQAILKLRRTSKTDTVNLSFNLSTSNTLLQKNSSVDKVKQKTYDSFNDTASNADCKFILSYSLLFFIYINIKNVF